MKLGLVFPQTEVGTDVEQIRKFFVGAEDLGFNFVAAYDHIAGHRPADPKKWRELGPYTDADQFHEVFVLFSFAAAITRRLELVTEVLVLPQRQTTLVAKQAAELQLVSGGRLRLGIGVGWNPEEYHALGMSFDDRGRRVEEQIALLRLLWSEDNVSYEGAHHALRNMSVNPRPHERIPIWIGGSAGVALRRAASIGDGFMFDHDIAAAPAVLKDLRRYLMEAGRLNENFGLAARVRLTDAVGEALNEADAWASLGITHLSLNTMGTGMSSTAERLEAARNFLNTWRQRESA